VNHGIMGHGDGDRVRVGADDEGTPLSFIWRRRLKAAEIDGCCEVVDETPPQTELEFDVEFETKE
jgi:hypothetical protein